ncbi:MAG: DUF3618 domain-containing protein [Vicinamibacterales bacterium]
MDETANTIEAHIDRTRERLGSNLRELEDRVDAATDWRQYFRERPYLFLGAALAAGAVLATATRRTGLSGELREVAARRGVGNSGSVQSQASGLWNVVQAALFGVAATRIKDYIGELVPGFDEHYREAEHRAAADSTSFRRTNG